MLFCSPLVMSKWELLSILQKWEGGCLLEREQQGKVAVPMKLTICAEREKEQECKQSDLRFFNPHLGHNFIEKEPQNYKMFP